MRLTFTMSLNYFMIHESTNKTGFWKGLHGLISIVEPCRRCARMVWLDLVVDEPTLRARRGRGGNKELSYDQPSISSDNS